MPPSKVTLTYFDARARGEQLRWILVQAGAKWEDKRIEQSAWPELKPKTPLGSMPFLEADGKLVGTSGAIALYLAREYGLMGANNLEGAQIHMLWECTQDAFNAKVKAVFCKDTEEQAKLFDEYFTQGLPKLIKLMACHLKGGKNYLVGNKLSMADLVTVCLLAEHSEGPGLTAVNSEPSVAALVARVKELPNIKKWIANRPQTEL